MKDLMKMLMNKDEQPEMSDRDIMAKMEVLKELMEMAEQEAGKGVHEGLKKVTVASPSSEGLEEGLEKAQEMLPEMEEKEEMMDEEMSEEMPSMSEEEHEEMKKKMKY